MISVFVMDNNKEATNLLEKQMAVMGYNICGVSYSCEEAIKKIETLKPDIVLTEITIRKDLDGIVTANIIQDKYNIPVIFLTSYAVDEFIEQIKMVQPYGYVLKPYDRNELKACIEIALYRKNKEKGLIKDKEFSESLIETAHAIILILDKEGKIVRYNKYMEELSGYKLEEVQGKDWFSTFLPKKDQKHIKKIFYTAVNDTPTKGNINPIISKKRELKYIEWYDKTLKNENGDIFGILAIGHDITERYYAAEKIRYQAMLLENISDAVISTDMNFIIKSWNKAAEEMYGWKEEEVTNKDFRKIIKPEPDWDHACTNISHSNEKIKFEGESVHHKKDGGKIYVWGMVTLINDDKGIHLGAVAINRDITEKKKTEMSLQESEERFRNLFSNAQVGLFQTRISDGKIIECNELFAKMGGYKNKDECIRGHITGTNYVDPKTRDQMLLELKKNGKISNFEANVRRKDGSPFWISFSVRIYPDKNIIEGACIDITDMKKAEHALKASENNLRAIFENAPEYWYMISAKGIIFDINKSALKTLGYEKKELIGKPLIPSIYATDSQQKAKRLFKNWNEKGIIRNEELTILTKKGEERIILLSAESITDEKDRVLHSISIQRDITERKQLEEVKEKELQFEKSISAISSRFIIRTDIDEAINMTLEDIGKLSSSDRSYIFMLDDTGKMNNTHEWCAKGIYSRKHDLQNIPASTFPWIMKKLLKNKIVNIVDTSALPKNAQKEKNIFKQNAIHSLLVSPLNIDGSFSGFIGIDNNRPVTGWDKIDHQVLKIISVVIGNALERKKAEDTLKINEERLKLSLESASEGLMDWNIQDNKFYFSSDCYKILGYKPYEFEAEINVFNKIIHPEDKTYLNDKIKAILNNAGSDSELEFRAMTNKGDYKWIVFKGKITKKTESGPPLRMLGTIKDVSRRKQIEKQLEEERAKTLSSVIDGQEIERQRLSRELHDGLGQSLIAIKLKLESISYTDITDSEKTINKAKDYVDSVIDEVRKISNDLLPSVFHQFGLTTALKNLCDEISQHSDINVSFYFKGNLNDLSKKQMTYLYRISQEALTNALKHSKATKIDVILTEKTNFYSLIIKDNGKGFNLDKLMHNKGNGLNNIRERTLLLDGTFNIRSSLKKGTNLDIQIPATQLQQPCMNY